MRVLSRLLQHLRPQLVPALHTRPTELVAVVAAKAAVVVVAVVVVAVASRKLRETRCFCLTTVVTNAVAHAVFVGKMEIRGCC